MEMKKSKFSNAFWFALGIIAFIVIMAISLPTQFQDVTSKIRNFIGTTFGWYYLIVVSMVVFVCFYIIVNPASKIRLGDPYSKPEHGTVSWIAMLFSAGMGIGLIFYGAAEPLSHFAINAPEAAEYSAEALSDALKFSFFHYGIHAWSVFAIVALAIAYFTYRKKEKGIISATLKPLFGKKMDGWLGTVVDTLTIVATVAGVATSLGFGAAQINGGLHFLFNAPVEFWVELVIIMIATVLFLISACSGVGKGVKILSNVNIVVAIILMIVALFVGPTVKALNNTTQSFGEYLRDFFSLGFRTCANGSVEQQEWIQQWTILYWSWWISWAPFVGVFIAKISKGRTIREFLVCVILIPSIFSILWFGIFGTLSTGAVAADHSLADLPLEQQLFGVFKHYPLGTVISFIAIVLIFTFFITSADSATYVLASQAERGNEPHNTSKIALGTGVSAIAASLLFSGGLNSLQNVLIIIAFPFSMILILLILSLLKEINYEKVQMGLMIKPETLPTKDDPFKSYEPNKSEKKLIREKRKKSIKGYCKRHGSITALQAKKLLDISVDSSRRMLHKMVYEGYLLQEGNGRNTYYVLNKKGKKAPQYNNELNNSSSIEDNTKQQDNLIQDSNVVNKS